MTTYELALAVSGVDDTDVDEVEALVAHREVVTVASVDGSVSVVVRIDGATPDAAVRSAVRLVEHVVDGSRATGVDLDLVAATDIARRAGVSRQAVNQWVADGGFPSPLGHVAGGTRVWAWSAVVPWLQPRGRALDDVPLPYASIIDANAWLQTRRLPAAAG